VVTTASVDSSAMVMCCSDTSQPVKQNPVSNKWQAQQSPWQSFRKCSEEAATQPKPRQARQSIKCLKQMEIGWLASKQVGQIKEPTEVFV
jgi:hypothetical protein